MPSERICSLNVNDKILDFWLQDSPQSTDLMVSRHGKRVPAYRVCGILHNGMFFRYPGLPVGWGFQLTTDRKIREVR